MLHPAERLETLRTRLKALPPKADQMTTRQIVVAMAEEIRELRRQRYSFETIAELLAEGGVQVAPATIRTYLPSAKRRRRRAVAEARPDSPAERPTVQPSEAPAEITRTPSPERLRAIERITQQSANRPPEETGSVSQKKPGGFRLRTRSEEL
jgi:hypothetical protein